MTERMDDRDRHYLRARAQIELWEMVLKEFLRAKTPLLDVAKALGKGPQWTRNRLGHPGYWTLDMASDFLWAISKATPTFSLTHPGPIRSFAGTVDNCGAPIRAHPEVV